MGVLSGFIGGAAKAGGEIAEQRISRYSAEMLAAQRDAADQAKEIRIEEMYNRRDKTNRENAVADEQAAYDKQQGRIPTERAAAIQQGLVDATGIAAVEAAQFAAGADNRAAVLAERRLVDEDDLKLEISRAGNEELLNPLQKIQLEAAKLALEETKSVAKMPPMEKGQYEDLREEGKSIRDTIIKARADTLNPFDEKSENALWLFNRQKEISDQMASLVTPFLDPANISAGGSSGGDGTSSIPQEAIDILKAKDTPENRAFFDVSYGAGSAESVLATPLNPLPQGLISTNDFSGATSGRGAAAPVMGSGEDVSLDQNFEIMLNNIKHSGADVAPAIQSYLARTQKEIDNLKTSLGNVNLANPSNQDVSALPEKIKILEAKISRYSQYR